VRLGSDQNAPGGKQKIIPKIKNARSKSSERTKPKASQAILLRLPGYLYFGLVLEALAKIGH
jgi:hypothetical protein